MTEKEQKEQKRQVELLVAIGSSTLREIQSNATLRRAIINSAPELVRRLEIAGIVFDKKTAAIKPKSEPKKGLLAPIKNEA